MVFFIDYALREWASRWGHGLRRLALSAVLLSALFLVIGFVPAVEFATLAGQEHAGYDFRVNGPLTSHDLNRVLALPGVHAVAPLTALAVSTADAERQAKQDILAYLCFEPAAQELTWFSAGLLVSGRALAADGDGEAVIDTAAARALGATIGDVIRFQVQLGTATQYSLAATVVGIYASSAPLNGAALLGPSAQARAVAEALADRAGRRDLLFSDLMVAGADPRRLEPALHDLFARDRDILVESRRSVIEHIRLVNQGVLGATWPVILPQAILLLYAISLVRDAGEKLRHRRREVATLIALGASDRLGVTLIVGEVLVESLLASVLAFPIARWVLSGIVRAYVPPETWLRMLGAFSVATAGGAFVVFLWAHRTFRRNPLARLIGQEGGG